MCVYQFTPIFYFIIRVSVVKAECRSGICYPQQLPTSNAISHHFAEKNKCFVDVISTGKKTSCCLLPVKSTRNCVISGRLGGKKRNFNWILSEVLSLLFIVYSAKWWKNYSPCKCGKGKERSRDSALMSIWRVFSLSRDLFVLLLIPQSSISPSLCEKMMLLWCEARHGLLTGTANWIQLAWPEIFLHIWTVTKSYRVAPWGLYLNALLLFFTNTTGYTSGHHSQILFDDECG